MKVRETVWKGDRGEGTIFYRLDSAGNRLSSSLYVSYRAEGREQVISAKTPDLEDAKRELKRLTRNRENAKEGKEPLATPRTERVTVADLLDAKLRRDQERNLASLRGIGYRMATLKRLLGTVRAVEFRPEHVDRYRAKRKADGVSDTTIRHELEILSGAFRYAVERRVLAFAPYVEKPTEDHVREKEIPLEAFPKILEEMSRRCEDSRDFAEWLLLTATRPKGARALRWEWLDLKAKTWTLKVPAEKKGNARVFSITGSLRRVIERRLPSRFASPFIFSHRGRSLSEDRARKVFYDALQALGYATGRASGFTLYDTKKTAAGLLIDSGLSEREAMHFSGHKTPSMFDRYVIKSAERHEEAVTKRDEHMARVLADKEGSDADSLVDFPKKSEVS